MTDPRTAYLEMQIITATPQKLRLMLIEAAVRFAQQARDAHNAGNRESFSRNVERARDIVTELLSSIRPEPHPLNESARALYTFVFQALAHAQLFKDASKVDDALRVLHEERETWQKVCELHSEAPIAEGTEVAGPQEIVAPSFVPSAATSTLSLDA